MKLQDVKIKFDKESCMRYLFEFAWIYPTLIITVLDIIMRRMLLPDYTGIAHGVIIVSVLLIFSRGIFAQMSGKQVLLYITIVMFYLMSIFVYPMTEQWVLDSAVDFLVWTVPLLFLGIGMYDADIDIKRLTAYSRIIIIVMSVVFFFMTEHDADATHMGRAYLVLPSVMLLTYQAFKDKKLYDIAIALLGGGFLIACSTRGAVLLLFVFVIWIAFVAKMRVLQGVLVASAVFILSSNVRNAVIGFGIGILSRFGFNTRIFDMMLLGNLNSDNGRDYLGEVVTEMIDSSPFWGNGLFSDRIATSELPWIDSNGVYAHNIILELWCQYGYIIGSILLLLTMLLCIYSVWKEKGDKRVIWCILICTYVGKLFMSSSYLIEPYFFLTVGVCYSTYKRNRLDNINKKQILND